MRKRVDPICQMHPEMNGKRTSQGKCVACQKRHSAAWRERNKEQEKARSAAYYQARGKVLAAARAIANAEHIRAYKILYRERNRESAAERTRKWRKQNYEKARAHEKQNWAKRYSLMGAQALAKRYAKAIRAFYLECPAGYHVDHIVPLRGKGVNGLHVPWNLQYLPAKENQRKGNRIG